MTKWTRCLLACTLSVLFLWPSLGVAQEKEYFTMAGFDGDESAHIWETNGFFTRMEERTGIGFTFEEYADYDKWQTAKENMFATGQLPDVLFKAELTSQELLRYTDSGQLIDLRPLLEENAPNLWALLTEHPDWLAAITLPNGKLGALPTLTDLPAQNAMWINQQWLDKLHLDMPTDTESLRAVLEAFKENDPNQNGKRDEVPFTFLGSWDLKFMSHAFGLVSNDYNIYVDESGTVCFAPAQPAYARLLTYLRGLYQDGLLDQNGFYTVDALRKSTDSEAAVTYGVLMGANPLALYPYAQAEPYVLLPPLSYEGKQVYRDLSGGQVTRGTFAITSACKDPAALLRWVDLLYTKEGAVLALAGEEGKDYTLDNAGNWQWAGGLTAVSQEQMNAVSIYDTGNMPWYFPLDFYNRYQEAGVGRINSEIMTLQSYIVEPFPAYTLTQAQRETVLPLQKELGTYVDESFARFVLGEVDITDETLTSFYEGLEERGLTEFLAFWQAIYEDIKP